MVLTALHPGTCPLCLAWPSPQTHSPQLHSQCQQLSASGAAALARLQKLAGGPSAQAKSQEARGSVSASRRLGAPPQDMFTALSKTATPKAILETNLQFGSLPCLSQVTVPHRYMQGAVGLELDAISLSKSDPHSLLTQQPRGQCLRRQVSRIICSQESAHPISGLNQASQP